MNIRIAEEKDYLQVEKLMKQVHDMHVELCPNIYKPEEIIWSKEEFMELVTKEEVLVAVKDEKVVGLLSYIFRIISGKIVVDRKVMFIESLVVDEKYRSRGIGRELLNRAKEIYKEKGCDSLELQVNAKNVKVWEMYKKYGFREKSVNMELV